MRRIIIFIIGIAFIASSCTKQPVASFTNDKDTYYAGDNK